MHNLVQDITRLLSTLWTRNLLFSDLLDILIVSILIYLALLLLRQTRSLAIALGIFSLGGLYLLSLLLNLYLTGFALQTVFSFLFLIIVVVFQSEIRRFFELMGLFGARTIKSAPPPAQTASQVIAAFCQQAAQNRTGALLVLVGKDDLSRFTTGGQVADALLSLELLESIFDPHSSGHDGAAIIASNRLHKFGVHLPLSTNLKEIGRHGTRHAAALGISELTDATAIVVSEEKGTISLAMGGKLKTLSSAELQSWLQKRLPPRPAPRQYFVNKILKKNFPLKVFSLFLACLIWFFFSYRQTPVTQTFQVPLLIEPAGDDLLVQDYAPKEISVTLQSRAAQSLQSVSAQNLKVRINPANLKAGLNSLEISKSAVDKPLNLEVVQISPSHVYLSVIRYRLVKVPIKVVTIGSPAKGYQVASVSSVPDSVFVLAPQEEPIPEHIQTEPINLSSANQNLIFESKLILPRNFKLRQGEQSRVSVAIGVTKK